MGDLGAQLAAGRSAGIAGRLRSLLAVGTPPLSDSLAGEMARRRQENPSALAAVRQRLASAGTAVENTEELYGAVHVCV